MAANDRLILFAVSMATVALAALCLYVCQRVEMRRLRQELNRVTVTELLCDDGRFDLMTLLKAYRISPRIRESLYGDKIFHATFGGGKRRLRFTLDQVNKQFRLIRIESRSTTWEYDGWCDEYDAHLDQEPFDFFVIGAFTPDEKKGRHKLPSFWLTEKAIRQLADACALL